MISLDKRHLLIIKYLINASEPLSSEILASVLGSTSRTIRTDMKIVERILDRVGAEVVSKSGAGYSLEIVNRGEFNVFLQSFNEKYADSSNIPQYHTERIRYIIHALLLRNEYIKSEDFLDKLFISRSTFSQDLKKIRLILARYHLELTQKPNYGLLIVGEERHLRVAIADYMHLDEDFMNSDEAGFQITLDYKRSMESLVRFLKQNNIHVSVQSLYELVAQLQISDYRIKHNYSIFYNDIEMDDIKVHEEFELLIDLMHELLGNVSESEIANFCLHIVTRRIYAEDDYYDIKEHKSLYFLGDEMLKFLFIYTDVDFSQDYTVRLLLTRELRGMLARINYGFEYRNIPMIEIKQSNVAFEYAVIMCDYLSKKYGYMIVEEEISVFANFLHYSMLVNRNSDERRNVCLVYYKGKNNTLIPKQQVQNYFGKYISLIESKEYYELSEENEKQYDLILTDMPRSRFKLNIPIIQVMNNFNLSERKSIQYLLSNKGMKLYYLHQAFNSNLFVKSINADTREEVIEYMSMKMSESVKITTGLKAMVLHRELLSSTERGNNVSIMHSLFPASEKAVIMIGVLKKPILWDRELVQLVFLVANGKEENKMFIYIEWLQALARQMNFVHEMLKVNNFKEAMQVVNDAFLETEL